MAMFYSVLLQLVLQLYERRSLGLWKCSYLHSYMYILYSKVQRKLTLFLSKPLFNPYSIL